MPKHGWAAAVEMALGVIVVGGIVYLQSQYKPLMLVSKLAEVRLLPDKHEPAPPETVKPPPPKLSEPVVIPSVIPLFNITPANTITVAPQPLPPLVVAPEPKIAPASPSLEVLTAYQALLRGAVQQAIIYPSAAKAAGIKGNARVAFDFYNGRVSNVEIMQSSGAGMIDRAAIAAVSSANMPAPPAELQDKKFRFLIVVTFALTS